MKFDKRSISTLVLLALTCAIPVPATAGTGTITQGSCYLTTADKKVNLATVNKGLVVTVVGEGSEGRFKVQVPMGDAKVQVATGWKNTGLPEGTGFVSKLFIKVDESAAPAPTASPADPAPAPKKKTGLLGLLGIGTDQTGDETAVQPGGADAGAGTSTTTKADPAPQPKAPAKNLKVRSLLAESKKGKTIILVNIPAQKLWVYKNGEQVLSAGCRVGEKERSDLKEGENSKTRVGEHRLISWNEKYANATYGPWTGSWFQFFEKNAGAFGAHTAKFNDSASQYVHGTYGSGVLDWAVINLTWLVPGSHGCVRVRNGDITSIRDIAPVGSQVVKVYTLKEGTQDAPPTADTYPNIYSYADVSDNGWVDPAKGELINYKAPKDAQR